MQLNKEETFLKGVRTVQYSFTKAGLLMNLWTIIHLTLKTLFLHLALPLFVNLPNDHKNVPCTDTPKGPIDSGVRQTHIVAHFTFHKFLDQMLVPDMPFNLIDKLDLLLKLSENSFWTTHYESSSLHALFLKVNGDELTSTFFQRHFFFHTLKSGPCTCGKTIGRKKINNRKKFF